MFRKLCILALVIAVLHLLAVPILGVSTAGILTGNLLQTAAGVFAAGTAFAAFRRASGLSRSFWLFVGCGLVVWGVANLGWMYYETVVNVAPPAGSVGGFLFGTQAIFFALAVFLNQDKNSPGLDLESVLDFVQIGIVFFFIYLGFYYLPARHMDTRSAYMREIVVETGENTALAVLALIQAARARVPQVRKMYRGFAIYLLIFTISACVASYVQLVRNLSTGTWLDMAFVVPRTG